MVWLSGEPSMYKLITFPLLPAPERLVACSKIGEVVTDVAPTLLWLPTSTVEELALIVLQGANAVACRVLPGATLTLTEAVHTPLVTVATEPSAIPFSYNCICVPLASEEIPLMDVKLEDVQKGPEITGAELVPPVMATELDSAEKQSWSP